jgi:hypothetical protein
MILTVPSAVDSRHVRGAEASLVWVGTDQDGEPVDPGVTVVTVSRSDGSVLRSAVATVADGVARSVTLTAAETAVEDVLTAVWTVDGVTVGSTRHDIVGGVLLTFATWRREAKTMASDLTLGSFLAARRTVDDLLIETLGRSLYPRVTVERVWHEGRTDLALSFPHLRKVLWTNWIDTDGEITVIEDVDQIRADPAGVARHDSWLTGHIEIGYCHGWDRPSAEAGRVAARLIKAYVSDQSSVLDDRAQAYTDPTGGTVQFGTEGRPGWYTSIPTVNEFIRQHKWEPSGSAGGFA